MRIGNQRNLWRDLIISPSQTTRDGETRELHYLSCEARREIPRGPWDECPGLFLPEKTLEFAFHVLPSPLEEELKVIAHPAWIPVNDASQFYAKAQKELRQQKEDLKCKAWKLHPLYKENKATLIERAGGCSNLNLKKYKLVQQVTQFA